MTLFAKPGTPDGADRHADRSADLRAKHYNATVTGRINVHDDLVRIEVRPDQPITPLIAGQYVTLGLGDWEPRIDGCQPELPRAKDAAAKVLKRAYSISCPITDESTSQLQRIDHRDTLEFYIVLVRQAGEPGGKAPELTPRLFALNVNDRLAMGRKTVGRYTLEGIAPSDTVWMIGTGTGEAPHNAMIATLLDDGHTGDIVHVTTVRSQKDLGYSSTHDDLMRRFSNYKYVPLTTRDPVNVDVEHPDYVGKRYIQQAYQSGWLSAQVANPLLPAQTHVFLCGNPAMIGYSPPGTPPPTTPGMLQILGDAGFTSLEDRRGGSPGVGDIRFEKYW